MPLSRKNCKGFHRKLFAGELTTVTLYKRGDNQRAGNVVALTLYQCRRGSLSKHGQPLMGDVTAGQRVQWHIPRSELERVGVTHLSALDRIVDTDGPEGTPRWWEPESTTLIEVRLFEVHVDLHCLRVDPPTGVPEPVS